LRRSDRTFIVECSVTAAHCEQKRAVTVARTDHYGEVAECESVGSTGPGKLSGPSPATVNNLSLPREECFRRGEESEPDNDGQCVARVTATSKIHGSTCMETLAPQGHGDMHFVGCYEPDGDGWKLGNSKVLREGAEVVFSSTVTSTGHLCRTGEPEVWSSLLPDARKWILEQVGCTTLEEGDGF